MSALLFAVAVGLATAPDDRIRIVSELDAAAASQLAPGETVDWFVDVTTTPGEPGTVDISIAEIGDLGLEVAAFRCESEWEGSVCAAGATRLREQSPLPAGEASLLAIPDTETAHLRMVVVAADDLPASAQGALRLLAQGAGDAKDVEGPRSPLQPTGSLSLSALVCAAVGALGAGAAITLTRIFRRRTPRTR
ncbi:hypothetical protein GCM10010910_24470 [Microbacterium nanhaiense]|uniref:Uncharacterized protein n=1 Tax=Microbacterium nanhaiense TaxID=1301026 RepID=A0ABQ2N460_9MICO|nr:hypothetical protein [Microbacterium nanhaiense]GGO66004.1 hypothetical protein GCM10010910_24470 [Microbacterium nanhaiense]